MIAELFFYIYNTSSDRGIQGSKSSYYFHSLRLDQCSVFTNANKKLLLLTRIGKSSVLPLVMLFSLFDTCAFNSLKIKKLS